MRRKLRRLYADGRTYTWRAVIRYVSGRREVRLRVWGAGKNGQALQVDLRPADPEHPLADSTYPTPADVHSLIVDGLAQGWKPQTTGGTFTLPPHLLAPPQKSTNGSASQPRPMPAATP
jgi:hypothetical protein